MEGWWNKLTIVSDGGLRCSRVELLSSDTIGSVNYLLDFIVIRLCELLAEY